MFTRWMMRPDQLHTEIVPNYYLSLWEHCIVHANSAVLIKEELYFSGLYFRELD